MDDASAIAKHGRTERRARGRADRVLDRQMPWRQPVNSYPVLDILSVDAIEAIHSASLDILERIGISVLSDSVRELCRRHGAEIMPDGVRVRFDRAMLMAAIGNAPPAFTLHARNPAHSLRIGDRHLSFATVSGPPNCSDVTGGRRSGTMRDYEKFLRLAQMFNVVHTIGGYPVEPLEVPVPVRHLQAMSSMVRLTDKVPRVYCHTPQRARDALEIIRIAAGVAAEDLDKQTITYAHINTNSPLQLDKAMVEGIALMAELNQATVITPFTLAGAMAPVTLIGAIAQQNAEALAGIAVSQFSRPGAPVVYGAFTTNVNMKSGAPAFGTPEYAKAALISGQLARRYRLPFRSSNINTANAPDAQSAYEGMMSTWSAITGGVNLLHHAAGWLEGGLCAGFEKFVIDVEILQMFASFLQPETVDAASLGLDAIEEVGPGGHFFASPHTLARYETAFYAPLLSDWRTFGNWQAAGGGDIVQRAAGIVEQAVAAYEEPALEPSLAEELAAFVAHRTEAGGAPVN